MYIQLHTHNTHKHNNKNSARIHSHTHMHIHILQQKHLLHIRVFHMIALVFNNHCTYSPWGWTIKSREMVAWWLFRWHMAGWQTSNILLTEYLKFERFPGFMIMLSCRIDHTALVITIIPRRTDILGINICICYFNFIFSIIVIIFNKI